MTPSDCPLMPCEVSTLHRGAVRGARFVAYDSVADYIRRSSQAAGQPATAVPTQAQLPIAFFSE